MRMRAALSGMTEARFAAAARAALAGIDLPPEVRAFVDASTEPGFGIAPEPPAAANAPAGGARPQGSPAGGGRQPAGGPAGAEAAPGGAGGGTAGGQATGARRHGMERQRRRRPVSGDLLHLAGARPIHGQKSRRAWRASTRGLQAEARWWSRGSGMA